MVEILNRDSHGPPGETTAKGIVEMNLKDFGDIEMVVTNAVWVIINLVIDIFLFLASDTSPL